MAAVHEWSPVNLWAAASGAAPAITAVSSARGADIATADGQITITGSNLAGITGVTVAGVACLNVVASATQVTADCPHGFGVDYGTAQTLTVSDGTASASRQVTVEPRAGTTITAFTVDYANLNPNSPFAGDPAFSAVVAGDSCIYDLTTSPDGVSVSMSGDGVFTLANTPLQNQTIGYSIFDASDKTDGPIGSITVSAEILASVSGNLANVSATFGAVAGVGAISQQQIKDISSSLTAIADVSASVRGNLESALSAVYAGVPSEVTSFTTAEGVASTVLTGSANGAAISTDTAQIASVVSAGSEKYAATDSITDNVYWSVTSGADSTAAMTSGLSDLSGFVSADAGENVSVSSVMNPTISLVQAGSDVQFSVQSVNEGVGAAVIAAVIDTSSALTNSLLKATGSVAVAEVAVALTLDYNCQSCTSSLLSSNSANSGYESGRIIKVIGGLEVGTPYYKDLTNGRVKITDNVIVVVDDRTTVVID